MESFIVFTDFKPDWDKNRQFLQEVSLLEWAILKKNHQ